MKIHCISFFFLSSYFFVSCSGCANSEGKKGTKRLPIQSTSTSGVKIKMKEENGVYKIPVLINGVEMYFIIDTGASMISISETEANFLYKQGTLLNSDFLGDMKFTDANGNINSGSLVRLRSVKIGNSILYNVQASVVSNSNAPLLLGQTALSRFGKISIDYHKKIIEFE